MTQKSVNLYIPENMLDAFYDAIRNNKLSSLHIPHSSVFYVRAAIEAKTGVRYTLKHVENAMKHEGMLEDLCIIRIGLFDASAKYVCNTKRFI